MTNDEIIHRAEQLAESFRLAADECAKQRYHPEDEIARARETTIRDLVMLVKRLLDGRFTTDEIHNFCHNLHSIVDVHAFADGCAEEQRRLYGCAPDRDRLSREKAQLIDVSLALGGALGPEWDGTGTLLEAVAELAKRARAHEHTPQT